jgi:hypothetical protein
MLAGRCPHPVTTCQPGWATDLPSRGLQPCALCRPPPHALSGAPFAILEAGAKPKRAPQKCNPSPCRPRPARTPPAPAGRCTAASGSGRQTCCRHGRQPLLRFCAECQPRNGCLPLQKAAPSACYPPIALLMHAPWPPAGSGRPYIEPTPFTSGARQGLPAPPLPPVNRAHSTIEASIAPARARACSRRAVGAPAPGPLAAVVPEVRQRPRPLKLPMPPLLAWGTPGQSV